MTVSLVVDYLVVALFGGLVGATELLSRYRDAPFRVIFSKFSIAYIILNLLAAMLALWMVRLFGINFGLDPLTDPAKLRWVQILVAGFSAMLLFRSSVFQIRVGEQDVAVGPNSVLDVLLSVLDREVDRERAQKRAAVVAEIMQEVSFRKASDELPVVAFALMQNLPREDQERIANKVLQLGQTKDLSDAARAYALGLTLMDYVGERVLSSSVELIEEEIKEDETAAVQAVAKANPLAGALRAALQGGASGAGEGEEADSG